MSKENERMTEWMNGFIAFQNVKTQKDLKLIRSFASYMEDMYESDNLAYVPSSLLEEVDRAAMDIRANMTNKGTRCLTHAVEKLSEYIK